VTKIILIGGTAGTGKSSLSIGLCSKYKIPQKIATGFIREIIKNDNDVLNSYTYSLSENKGYKHLLEQTKLLKKAINLCIDRAFREGTSLIIEGTHVLPWIINNKHVTNSFMLYVEDKHLHKKMIEGKSHSKRVVTDEEFDNIRDIQKKLIVLSKKYNIPLVESTKEVIKL